MPAASPDAADAATREVTIERVYDAPARLLFRAWSECEHLKRWFGPVGWPVTMCEVDFRVGGRFRMAMTGPGGTQNPPFGGTYLEIVPDRRIVFDNGFLGKAGTKVAFADGFEAAAAEKMVWTVTFDETAGRTTLTIHTLFASPVMYRTHTGAGFVEGLSSGLDQLTDVVAGMK